MSSGLIDFDFATTKIKNINWPDPNGAIFFDTDWEPDDGKAFMALCVAIQKRYGKGPYPELVMLSGEGHSGIQHARTKRYVELAQQSGLLPTKMKVHCLEGEGSAKGDYSDLGLDVLSQEEIDKIRAAQPDPLNPNILATRKELVDLLETYQKGAILNLSLKPPIDMAIIAAQRPKLFERMTTVAYGGGYNYNQTAPHNNERHFDEEAAKNFFAVCAQFVVLQNFIMIQNRDKKNEVYRSVSTEHMPEYVQMLAQSKKTNPLADALMKNNRFFNQKILQNLVKSIYGSMFADDKLVFVKKNIANLEKERANILANQPDPQKQAEMLADNAEKMENAQKTLTDFTPLNSRHLSAQQLQDLRAQLKKTNAEGFSRNLHPQEALQPLEDYFSQPHLVDEFIKNGSVRLDQATLDLILTHLPKLNEKDSVLGYRKQAWAEIAQDIDYQSVIADPLTMYFLDHPETIDDCEIGALWYKGAFLNINSKKHDPEHCQAVLGTIKGGALQAFNQLKEYYLYILDQANQLIAKYVAENSADVAQKIVMPRVSQSGNAFWQAEAVSDAGNGPESEEKNAFSEELTF